MTTQPSSDHVVLIGTETAYVPPAFQVAGLVDQDRPHTACASCPSGIWYQQPEWRCFCNVMKFQTWGRDAAPIPLCDARETSVAKYNEELEGMGDGL